MHNSKVKFTCHVLILTPFCVLDKIAPLTWTSCTSTQLPDFPKLPILQKHSQQLFLKKCNYRMVQNNIKSLYYLIPCPGLQKIFLIRILEELLTIDMQSSPFLYLKQIFVRRRLKERWVFKGFCDWELESISSAENRESKRNIGSSASPTQRKTYQCLWYYSWL